MCGALCDLLAALLYVQSSIPAHSATVGAAVHSHVHLVLDILPGSNRKAPSCATFCWLRPPPMSSQRRSPPNLGVGWTPLLTNHLPAHTM